MAWASCYSPEFRVHAVTGVAAGTTALVDRRLSEATNGVPTFTADAIDAGRVALTMTPSAGAVNIAVSLVAATPRYAGAMCRFMTPDFDGGPVILSFIASNSTNNVLFKYLATTGETQYSFNNGTTFDGTGFSFTAGQVYRLELFVDWGTDATHTLKLRIDGDEIGVFTGGANTVTNASSSFVRFGATATATSTVLHYSDLVTYNDPAQYGAMDDWRVWGLEPTADGTHAVGSGAFKDAGANSLSDSTTTAWTFIDDAPSAPPSGADFVRQTVDDANAYMEVVLRAMPTGYDDPILVALPCASYPSSSGANLSGFKLKSGSNISAESPIDTSGATNTVEYRMHLYPTEPGGAAWTVAKVKDTPLRARVGYTTLIPAQGGFAAIMAWVVAPVTPNTLVSGSGSGTSTTSASATGVASSHVYAGAAVATSATSGAATGVASAHLYEGAASATTATSANATGSASAHLYVGTAASTSATSGAAVGTRLGGAGVPYVVCAASVDSNSSGSSDSITTNVDVPEGDTLVIIAMTRLSTTTEVTSVPNDGGLSSLTPDWKTIDDAGSNGHVHIIRIYAHEDIPSGTQFTVNYNGSPTRHCVYALANSGIADTTIASFADGSVWYADIEAASGAGGATTTAGAGPAAGDWCLGLHNHYGTGANGMTADKTAAFDTEILDHQITSSTPFLHAYIESLVLTGGGPITSAPTFSSTTGGLDSAVIIFAQKSGAGPVGGSASGTSASAASASGAASSHLYQGTASASTATNAAASGVASLHLYSGTSSGTSATSSSASGSASSHTGGGTATGTSATSAAASASASHHQYDGTASGTSATTAAATGSSNTHLYSGTATGTSGSSGTASTGIQTQGGLGAFYPGQVYPGEAFPFVAVLHVYEGTATATSQTTATATGSATRHQYDGTATATTATSGSASGTATPHLYSGTASATSQTSATATGAPTGKGTSASSGTATGTASNHHYAGNASATSQTTATATGTASNHLTVGTASGSSQTSAVATGVASRHAYQGTSAGSTATSGSATGVASKHLYAGSATASSSTSATATGTASRHLYQGSAVATSQTSGVAEGAPTGYAESQTSGHAIGIATRHVYQGSANATNSTSAAAIGSATVHIYQGTATASSQTSGHANATQTYMGHASGTSRTRASARGRILNDGRWHQYETGPEWAAQDGDRWVQGQVGSHH